MTTNNNHARPVKRRRPRKMSTADRVLLVHRIVTGQMPYVPSTKAVCEWAGIAESYYRTFRRLKPGQRAAVEARCSEPKHLPQRKGGN